MIHILLFIIKLLVFIKKKDYFLFIVGKDKGKYTNKFEFILTNKINKGMLIS